MNRIEQGRCHWRLAPHQKHKIFHRKRLQESTQVTERLPDGNIVAIGQLEAGVFATRACAGGEN
ncbi:MAG: hypothetical protein K1X74_21495 [Pirellulales bacterium]|nr:hypothetical protein [Pirellulales bacterium]